MKAGPLEELRPPWPPRLNHSTIPRPRDLTARDLRERVPTPEDRWSAVDEPEWIGRLRREREPTDNVFERSQRQRLQSVEYETMPGNPPRM